MSALHLYCTSGKKMIFSQHWFQASHMFSTSTSPNKWMFCKLLSTFMGLVTGFPPLKECIALSRKVVLGQSWSDTKNKKKKKKKMLQKISSTKVIHVRTYPSTVQCLLTLGYHNSTSDWLESSASILLTGSWSTLYSFQPHEASMNTSVTTCFQKHSPNGNCISSLIF